MHQYVDKLFKEVSASKVLDRTLKSEESEVEEHSQKLDPINEIGSENEHSYLNVPRQESRELSELSELPPNCMTLTNKKRLRSEVGDEVLKEEEVYDKTKYQVPKVSEKFQRCRTIKKEEEPKPKSKAPL